MQHNKKNRDGRRLFLAAFLLAIVVLTFSACSSEATVKPVEPPTKEGGIMQWSSPPPMTIDRNKEYTATIKTNFGEIKAQLFPQDAPLTVNNFVFLAGNGFYDGVKFHRVVKGFVIQGGDPTGTGAGGPGSKFADEKVTRDYVTGTLAMANAGPDTNGSQFFITLADLSGRLPKKYTIFGQVTSGLDIVKEIGAVPVKASAGGELSSPTVDVHIDTITIEAK
jgi:cyclophilin family peptidyl-prolyl cis-trans isomerase